jgi:hypothetical protein
VKGRSIALNPVPFKDEGAARSSGASAPAPSTAGETANASPPPSAAAPSVEKIVEVNFPNFTSCPMEELLITVPDLKGLKPADDQEQLLPLLNKVGAKTLDIARNTPNLISREIVTERQPSGTETHHEYDYLILAHIEGNNTNLDEFRVDRKSGEKFQTDDILKTDSSARADLERASEQLAISGKTPASQGFATSWVHFYSHNQSRATYRYLGEQKMEGRRTLVLAFAQKPDLILYPAMFRYQGKLTPMYLQGVAWVDPSDFRILRLRTDLLAPLPEVSLHQLTADIHFELTRIESVPLPVSLPHEVTVTSTIGGSTLHEVHKYSEYRLFRATSRIVPVP